jgi:hypothetical protein
MVVEAAISGMDQLGNDEGGGAPTVSGAEGGRRRGWGLRVSEGEGGRRAGPSRPRGQCPRGVGGERAG